MRICWANSLRDCGGGISGEHPVSRALFDGPTVEVVAPWTSGEVRSIPLARLRANILCRRHNAMLSPVDSAGGRAFRGIRDLDTFLARARRGPRKTKTCEVDGQLLERWFLKTSVNLFVSSQAESSTWAGGTPRHSPPPDIVSAAFGCSVLARPKGLYCWAGLAIGEELQVGDRLHFTPVYKSATQFVGAHFVFQGLKFLAWFVESPPPWPDIPRYFRHMGGIFHDGASSGEFTLRWNCQSKPPSVEGSDFGQRGAQPGRSEAPLPAGSK
jgi:hypothetical protein